MPCHTARAQASLLPLSHALPPVYPLCARVARRYVHIWVEPPKMGDEYIFFARSDQQRKPMKREKLREWYKRMLDKAKEKKIVERYGSMQDLFGNMKSVSALEVARVSLAAG
jgi:hypothetical protein